MPPTIALKNVCYSITSGRKQVEILRDISLEIAEGELVAIMGPSGCGKSTLLSMVGGLATPTSGEVFVDGTAIHSASSAEGSNFRLNRVGYVFQEFNLVPSLSVAENASLTLELLGNPVGASRAVAERNLSAVGLADRANDFPDDLSGGERQRVALARSLAGDDNRILLADEPTGSLDSANSEIVLDLLFASFKSGILVTHDDAVASRASRVVRMLDGEIVS